MKKIKRMSKIRTREVSLVREPAVARHFAIAKNQQENDVKVNNKMIQAVMGTKAEGEDELVADLVKKNADSDVVSAAVAKHRLEAGFADLLRSEKDDEKREAVDANKGADEAEVDEDLEVGKGMSYRKASRMKKMIEKMLEGADESSKASLKKMSEFMDDLIEDEESEKSNAKSAISPDDLNVAERLAKAEKANEFLIKAVSGLKKIDREREFIAKARSDYRHVPMATADIVKMLHDADGAGALEQVEKTLERLAEVSKLNGGGGTRHAGSLRADDSADPWGRIEALAESAVKKSAGSGVRVSHEQAIAEVLKSADGDALYQEYLMARPWQRAKLPEEY